MNGGAAATKAAKNSKLLRVSQHVPIIPSGGRKRCRQNHMIVHGETRLKSRWTQQISSNKPSFVGDANYK